MPTEQNGNQIPEGAQYEMDIPRTRTTERVGFVNGLFEELQEQLEKFLTLVQELAVIQARVQVVEQNLEATRNMIHAQLNDTEEETPEDWEESLQKVRFVGVRLGDACVQVLKERKVLTTDELRRLLDYGQFRFRTGFPLREMNAALLRHPRIHRKGDTWTYKTPDKRLATSKVA